MSGTKSRPRGKAPLTPWQWFRACGYLVSALVAIAVGVWVHGVVWTAELEQERADLHRAAVLAEQRQAGSRVGLPEPVETLAHLIEHSDELVVVDPQLEDTVTPAALSALRQQAADVSVPVRVGYVPDRYSSLGGYTYLDLAEEWALYLGEPGIYVVITSAGDTESYAVDLRDPYLLSSSSGRGQPAPAIARVLETVEESADQVRRPERAVDLDEVREDEVVIVGTGGGLALGLGLIGLFVIVPLFALTYWLAGRRPARPSRRTRA